MKRPGFLDLSVLPLPPVPPVMMRIGKELARVNVTDKSMTLAGQAFTSMLPILLLLSTLPGRGIIDRYLDTVFLSFEELLGTNSDDVSNAVSFGVAGALMTIVSATSFARALDRMYVAVWRTRPAGIRGWWRWLLVLLIVAVGAVAQAFVVLGYVESRLPLVVAAAATYVIWSAVWTAVPRTLIGRQLPTWQLGLLGATTGAGLTVLIIFTQIGFARVVASAEESYGVLGIVFTIIGWLFVYSAVVVASTAVVRTLLEEPSPDWSLHRSLDRGGDALRGNVR